MKYIYVITFILFLFSPGYKANDLKISLGRDYQQADKWIINHKIVFENKANEHSIPSKMLMAIVFPEIIRYNAVYDFMETAALNILYVDNGSRYADFSIGHFQMKPSFAELVEQDARLLLDSSIVLSLDLPLHKSAEDAIQRQERINRLENIEGQLNYLVAFYMICRKKFSSFHFSNQKEMLKYYATCYNSGYRKKTEDIKSAMQNGQYYTGRFSSSSRLNYSDVSCTWFENISKNESISDAQKHQNKR